ncbi:cyclopentanone 1,2-monooxygenase, partial [Colletotrichum limetticola]
MATPEPSISRSRCRDPATVLDYISTLIRPHYRSAIYNHQIIGHITFSLVAMEGQKANKLEADVIIVGAGFSGCYALFKVREAGFSAKILERGDDFGGVWHFNRYPGARVDSDTPAYQFSLPRVWADFHFTERFPGCEEIRRYFRHVDATLGLRQDTIFDAQVDEAKTTKGLRATSKHAIYAYGSMNKPYMPLFPNQDLFDGLIIHPSAWPDNLSLTGKKISIVGQGASGLQIVQELAPLDCELTVFVHNPYIAVPIHQRQLSYRESEEMKHYYNTIFAKAKFGSSSALPYNQNSD